MSTRADQVARIAAAAVALREGLDPALGELVRSDVSTDHGHARVLRDLAAELEDAYGSLDRFDVGPLGPAA
jgi:hypothetical protein